MQPIRILNFVPNMRAAGIETFIMNMYRNIDRTKVQFDFVVHSTKKEFYDDEIKKMGGRIYYLTFKDDKNIIKYVKDLKKLFIEHPEYNIVHGHMQSMMPLYLYVAKKMGVAYRIGHSHNNSYEKSLKGFILHLFSRFSRYSANLNFACSSDSCKYLFGNSKYVFIPNGIDVEKFTFDATVRDKYRKEMKLDDKLVIGHVGRFEKQKNHVFLLKIFKEILKKRDAILILIGEGKLKTKIEKMAIREKISDHIMFLGIRNDVNKIMNAIDVFALPSLYEGLGIVLIEGQTCGLKVFATKDKVAKETNVTPNITYLPLGNPVLWCDSILNSDITSRDVNLFKLKNIFDAKSVARKLEEIYIMLDGGDDIDNIYNRYME